MALNANVNPKQIRNCSSAAIGSSSKCQEKPTAKIAQKTKMMTQEMKKLMIPAETTDKGKISLGKYTFLIIPAFTLIEAMPWFITVVKKVHGMTPVIKYTK